MSVPTRPYGVKEVSHNVRLLLLAVRLQRPVKRLPAHLISSERITRGSLAEEYLSSGNSRSEAGAFKMAVRHLQYMEEVFGLDGDQKSGFVMHIRFERYLDLLTHWVDVISPPKSSDRRLHVMLTGLIHVIENGFSRDPISVPNLARALKKRFGATTLRDMREPLDEMFDNHTLASWLSLYDNDDDTLAVDRDLDPLLLRLRNRHQVGGNRDVSIPLAISGHIYPAYDDIYKSSHSELQHKLSLASEGVKQSRIWNPHDISKSLVPFILFKEGQEGPIILTLWDMKEQLSVDVPLEEIVNRYRATASVYNPYGISHELRELIIQFNE